MQLLDLLDKIDDTAPRSCRTCVFMATHEKCDGCLTRPEDYAAYHRGEKMPPFRYAHWTPGNWLRREHESQLSGVRSIVVGGCGEAEVNATATPAEACKHLNYVANECGYWSEPLQRSEVFHVRYNAVVTEARKKYHTDAQYEIVWINEKLDRIDRIAHTGERVCTWNRATPEPQLAS